MSELVSAPLLRVTGLTLSQGGRTLLQALDLNIRPGECWALLGRNGAGKTTLLHTLAGLIPAQQGHIELLDRPLNAWQPRQRARHLGLLLQDASEGFEANVLEAALCGRHPYIERWAEATDEDRAITQRALARCGLDGFAERRINSLSGGERRRLGLATLLAQNPPLMLLDEPLNHLDMAWQWRALRQLRELAGQGHAVLMSLHDPNMALHSCTHVLLMQDHGAWQAGRVEDLLTPKNLHAVYGLKLLQLDTECGAWLIPDMQAAHIPL
ncbi:MAG TPA: ABC transporter ATP-binding protein [bacterium]|nr:ABC transporter ATP-binding protein [bacterium]